MLHSIACGRAALPWLLVLWLGGCASNPGVDVALIGLEPLETNLFEQRLRLDFRVQNLGEREIRATGLRVDLKLNDARLARGVDDGAFVVPRLSDARASAVVSASLFDVARQLLSLPEHDSFTYELSGRIYLDGWPRSWGFVRAGVITREELQRLTGAGPHGPAPLRLE